MIVSFSAIPSVWKWICAARRCESMQLRNGQRKAIIRTHRQSETGSDYISLVPAAGVEPARCRHHWILSPARLPIPSRRHKPLFYFIILKIIFQASNAKNHFSFCRKAAGPDHGKSSPRLFKIFIHESGLKNKY
jgi:hypothetical protein